MDHEVLLHGFLFCVVVFISNNNETCRARMIAQLLIALVADARVWIVCFFAFACTTKATQF